MAPVAWNGSDFIFNNVSRYKFLGLIQQEIKHNNVNMLIFQILFPLFKEHHEEIEEQAEAVKMTVLQKLGMRLKKEKVENVENKDSSNLQKN